MNKYLIILSISLLNMSFSKDSPIHKKEVRSKMFWVSQTPTIANGEYFTVGYYVGGPNNGKLYQIIGNAQVVAGMPGVVNASAGTHNVSAVDSSGFVWTFGDNGTYGQGGTGTFSSSSYGPTKILTDSSGATFNNVAYTIMGGNAYGWNCIAVKNDGTVWEWGHIWNRLSSRPVKVVYPVGTVITQVCAGLTLMALDTAGQVHVRYGGNQGFATQYINPQGTATPDTLNDFIVSLPARARRIGGGSFWNFAELVTNRVYGWGPWPGFLGIGDPLDGNSQHGPLSNIPQRVDTGWTGITLNAPLLDLKVNNAAVFFITADSVLHGMGDATQGTIGNGSHVNMATYSPPYAWNQSENPAQLLVRKPVVVLPGINVARIFCSNALNYDTYAQDGGGNLYAWGRDKGGPQGLGIIACDAFGVIAATYPNSWDEPWARPTNPWTATNFGTTSPFCVGNPGGSQCSTSGCLIGVHANPTANAGGAIVTNIGKKFTLDASGSTAASTWGLNFYLWSHISGPNNNTLLPAFMKSPMTNSIAGVDTYQVTVTDNGWQTNTSTVTVVTLPANSIGPIPVGIKILIH